MQYPHFKKFTLMNEEEQLSSTIDGLHPQTWYPTCSLRYKMKRVMIDEETCKYEKSLQQKWQGSAGEQKWEWIETVD